MLKPLNNHLISKLIETPPPKGKLILTMESSTYLFEVVAIGPNDQGIKVGDKVVIGKYGPEEIYLEGEKLYALACDKVLAVMG